MITLAISDDSAEFIARVERLPRELQRAIYEKMSQGIAEVYAKVSGALPSFKYTSGVEQQGSMIIGYVEPAEPKAIAREFGGKGYYEIVPTKARLLRFIGTRDGKRIAVPYVFHPPMRAFGDIRQAMEETLPSLEADLEEILLLKLRGR